MTARAKTVRSRKKAQRGQSLRVQRLVRELPEDARCSDCGETAANAGCSRRLEEIDATDRNFIEHWSKWKNGTDFILGSEPEETYPLDARGETWEVCGDCGCPRWNLPNDQAQRPPPATPGRLQQSLTNYPNRPTAQQGGGSLQRPG